jgi:hypothetical protein
MANYRVISSDNHVFESPDLWTSRAKPAFKDRVHLAYTNICCLGQDSNEPLLICPR